MPDMTIAEALSETKRIQKLINNRINNIRRYSSKMPNSRDEIEKQESFVKSQGQSARDLIRRYVDLKCLIADSNNNTRIPFKGDTMSITEALLFKQWTRNATDSVLNAYVPDNGLNQIRQSGLRIQGVLTDEQKLALDLVPKLYYSEVHIRLEKERNLELYSMIDVLIDKSNHNTYISIGAELRDKDE